MIDVFAVGASGLLLVATLQLLWNLRYFEVLAELKPVEPAKFPSVSIVVPACDEERGVEAAIGRMTESDYPDLEVIAINDRSTDRTGELLDRLAADRSTLRVEHVVDLPEGWLGKVNALESGRRSAEGELLLFIDGDVQLQPGALRRAVALLVEQDLDHVSLIPAASSGTWIGQILMNSSIHVLMSVIPARYICDADWATGAGSGCFNLVRASVLEELGGFEKIRLEVIDDAALGVLIGSSGYRSRCFSGRGSVHVEWYSGARDLVRGLEKNAFAGLGYHLPLAVAVIAFAALFWVSAFIGPWLSSRPWVLALALFVQVGYGAALMVESRRMGFPRWADLFYPLGSWVMPFIVLRSAVVCMARGAVEWRGTRYSLRELRSARVMGAQGFHWMRLGLVRPPRTS